MILISIFIFFIGLFAYITQSSSYSANYNTKDLIKSFVMHTKLLGYLPVAEQNKIPWTKIGISESFFPNFKNVSYAPTLEYTNKELIPIDSLHWIMNQFSNAIFYDVSNTQNISILKNEIALQLEDKNIKVIVTKEMLLNYANFDPNHHKRIYKGYYADPKTYIAYPTSKLKLIHGYLI